MNEASPERAAPPPAEHGARLSLRGAAAEITIRGLLETLWRGWVAAAGRDRAGAAGHRGRAQAAEPALQGYHRGRATIVVAPAPTDLSAASQRASELERFASFAALAQSPAKLERVSTSSATRPRSRPTAGRAWPPADRLRGRLRRRESGLAPAQDLVAVIEHAVLGFFGFLSWTEPDIAALAEWLDGQVNVARMGGSAMLRLQMEHPRPEFAASVVEIMHETADALLRESALERTGAQISRVGQLADPRAGAGGGPARPVPGSGAASRRSALRCPGRGAGDRERAADLARPLLILALAAMVGAILGIFAVFLRDALRAGGG